MIIRVERASESEQSKKVDRELMAERRRSQQVGTRLQCELELAYEAQIEASRRAHQLATGCSE